MTKKELDRIFRDVEPPSHGWEHLPPPPVARTATRWPAWHVVLVLAFIVWFLVSAIGCTTTDGVNQISAGWETVKSRTEIGVGFKADDKGIAFPLLVRWLAKPTPDDIVAERIEQVITPQK